MTEIKIENISLKKTKENDWWDENFPWSNSILLLRKKTLFAYVLIIVLFPICFPLEIIYRTPRYVSDRLFGGSNIGHLHTSNDKIENKTNNGLKI